MVTRKALVAIALLCLSLSGCPDAHPEPPKPEPILKPEKNTLEPVREQENGGQPQQGLPMARLLVGGQEIEVEVAATFVRRKIGLMYRLGLPENRGMIFIYPERDYRSFWMKNTLIPLSIAYIRDDGSIADIIEMAPSTEDDPRSYPSSEAVRYCLEMNQGWFKKRGIKVGDIVSGLEDAAQAN